MSDMALDTHAFVKTLTAAGMPEAQAEAVTSVVRQSHEKWFATLVTKDDLKHGLGDTDGRLRFALSDTESRLKLATTDSENKLKLGMADSENKLKLGMADSENRLKLALSDSEGRLRLALAETKADIMKWMIGTVGGAVIINATAIIGAMLALTKMTGH